MQISVTEFGRVDGHACTLPIGERPGKTSTLDRVWMFRTLRTAMLQCQAPFLVRLKEHSTNGTLENQEYFIY